MWGKYIFAQFPILWLASVCILFDSPPMTDWLIQILFLKVGQSGLYYPGMDSNSDSFDRERGIGGGRGGADEPFLGIISKSPWILNLQSQCLNSFVFTGLNAQKLYYMDVWGGNLCRYLFYNYWHRTAVLIIEKVMTQTTERESVKEEEERKSKTEGFEISFVLHSRRCWTDCSSKVGTAASSSLK